MHLPHHRRLALLPGPIPIAEGRVPDAVRVRREELDVQQGQRHARPPHLQVKSGAVRLRPQARQWRLGVHPRLQLRVRQRLHGRSVETMGAGVREHPGDRARADADRPGHLTVAATERQFLSQDLSQVMHGESLCRHAAL